MDIGNLITRAGGPTRVGRIIGRHYSTVLRWRRVPAEHVRAIAAATGIARWELRPDLYDPPPPAGEHQHREAA